MEINPSVEPDDADGFSKQKSGINKARAVSPLVVSIRKAAEILDISESSCRRLIARGLLRPSRMLRKMLIPIEQIEELIRSTTGGVE